MSTLHPAPSRVARASHSSTRQQRNQGLDWIQHQTADWTRQAILKAEISEHFGYDKHDPQGRNGGNSRNGTRAKTVLTEVAPVQVEVPRDRDGSFDPVIVGKRQRRRDGEGQGRQDVVTFEVRVVLQHLLYRPAGG
jgi:transposase-like protein